MDFKFWIFSIDYSKEIFYVGNYPIDLHTILNIVYIIMHIILILVLMFSIIKIGNAMISKFVKKQIKSKASFTLDEKKANTIGEVLKSVLRYGVYFFGLAAIIGSIFSGVSLTVASVGGVALGFGAQSLVKDLINGFFILFENQYAVGEYITLSTSSGIVESIGIRTTVLKDLNGDIHLIPNGVITEITNHSRSPKKVVVDIPVQYEENIDKVMDVLNLACKRVSEGNEYIVDAPTVLGIDSYNKSLITIKIAGTAKPMHQWDVERALNKEIKDLFDSEGISAPYPKTEFVNANNI